MTQKWTITVTTESGETFTGAMTRQEPSLVNGFVAVATEDGEWIFLKPDTVTKMHLLRLLKRRLKKQKGITNGKAN